MYIIRPGDLMGKKNEEGELGLEEPTGHSDTRPLGDSKMEERDLHKLIQHSIKVSRTRDSSDQVRGMHSRNEGMYYPFIYLPTNTEHRTHHTAQHRRPGF